MATDEHICEHCGYDLSTSIRGERDEVTCPECGGHSLPEQAGTPERFLRGVLSATTRDLLSTFAVLLVVGVLLYIAPGFPRSTKASWAPIVRQVIVALFPLTSLAWAAVLVIRARANPRLRRHPGKIAKATASFLGIAGLLMIVPVIAVWLLIVIVFALLL